jgi:hypothetical protein
VLALSWLLERSDGRRFVVVTLSSSTTGPIEDADGAAIAREAIDRLAEAPSG